MLIAIIFLVSSSLICQAVAGLFGTCYNDLGCFYNTPPFGFTWQRPLGLVPQSPSNIKTKFRLYTRTQRATPLDLEAVDVKTSLQTTWPDFSPRPTKFVIHGFLDGTEITTWSKMVINYMLFYAFTEQEMKEELLTKGDYNVILVDWSAGAVPIYTQATANTRLVGPQIGLLINQLIGKFNLLPKHVHIIGHSLGAHTAGYAGERVPGLGRITGLDPAGPEFDGTPAEVRLDPTDAMFVDVIHSDMGSLINFHFGITQNVGRVDFYPNLGHNQPGCSQSTINSVEQWGLISGSNELMTCSHNRAVKLFKESINSVCSFTSYSCDSEDKFKSGQCTTCGPSGCANMGFWADTNKNATGKYYIKTNGAAPFCTS
ncbi:inactive pancreatic lipase-related protein 1-like [Physella acuta]|uniref:inactive pancreatic lipase-related protein 1-like n=1 Tax=Physella acuta TaxID=109671 RepID=UPI0027DABFA7|nr:inactive pancreatic lipase-related protein 1-like [Physella acuta]